MVDFSDDISKLSGDVSNQNLQEVVSAEVAKKILLDFMEKDTDASMRVSFDELSNAIIREYVANGYRISDKEAAGTTITDLLNYYQERAKEFDLNGDGALNIDEYTAMFKEKFEKAEKELMYAKATDKSNITDDSSDFVCESSAVKFEKTFETGKKSAEIVDKFVEE